MLDGHLPDDRDVPPPARARALRPSPRATASCGPAAACSPPTTRSTARTGSAPATRIPHTVVPGPELDAAPPADDELRFLYVGRLERRKGVQNLIRAATALPGDDWSLTLVGGDTPTAPLGHSMRDQLELMIGADPRIRMLDRVPREHLRSLYAGARRRASRRRCGSAGRTPCSRRSSRTGPCSRPRSAGTWEWSSRGRNGWLAADTSADALLDRMEEIIGARERAGRDGRPRTRRGEASSG